MTVDDALLVAAVRTVAVCVADTKWRLVGTASSVTRGAAVPAADVDVLFYDREGVDATFERLRRSADSATAPEWLESANQYFARLSVDGVMIELSTVEIATELDTWECFGPGPWIHFDEIDLAGVPVPAVASELRLVTEIRRGRTHHITCLVDYLRHAGCDLGLLEQGLVDAELTSSERAELLDALSR